MGNWPKVAGPTDCNHFLPPPSRPLQPCSISVLEPLSPRRRSSPSPDYNIYGVTQWTIVHYTLITTNPRHPPCTTHIRYVDICVVNDWLMQVVRQQWIVMNKGPLTWHINEEWSVTMMININPSYPCKMGTYEVHTISWSRDSWHPWRLDHHLSADGGENIYMEWKYLYGSSNRVLLC